jgi:hypothetical protein
MVRMLAAIDLDDQTCLATAEIRDVAPDRFLTHELEAAEASVAQPVPETALRLCLGLTQMPTEPGTFRLGRSHPAHFPRAASSPGSA